MFQDSLDICKLQGFICTMLHIKHWVVLTALCCPALAASRLSDERIVFQTKFGDIEMALYPEVCFSTNP
jgi:hypothetical protein